MPRATKKTLTAINKANTALAASQRAIYHMAPDDRTPWKTCYSLACPALQENHEKARLHLEALEAKAVEAGQAWRGPMGMIYFYSS